MHNEMTADHIASFIRHETQRGASANAIRNARKIANALFEWLPEDKVITRQRLVAWRQSLKDRGYTSQTELSYVKGINRYLDFAGLSELRFNRGRARDIAGQQFGRLTAIAPAEEQTRRDVVWHCRCSCGKEVEYPATRLLTGHTLSCGCLKTEQLHKSNKYVDGTSLRQALQEQVTSTRAASGYTGVIARDGKWKAYIKYKGQTHSLGYYTRLEDAVKARARGKDLVRKDAQGLLDFYEELHRNDPAMPDREQIKAQYRLPKPEQPEPPLLPAVRSNNTSGYPGVSRKRSKWTARITYKKRTYHLGIFDTREEAIEARKGAEEALQEDPAAFAGVAPQQLRSG